MIAKTLAEGIRAVEYGAGIRGQVGSGSTFRHPTDDVIAEFNSAYVEFRELMVERDFPLFLLETALTDLPSTRADTNENYSLIPWALTMQVIKRVDVYQNNEWSSLTELDWAGMRDAIQSTGSQGGRGYRPLYFSPKSFGTVSGATEAAGEIALAPFGTGGKYKLSYLPTWTAITDTTHKFIFPHETGFRWTVWNCIARLLIRDEDPGGRYTKSENERAKAEARIGRFQAKTIQTGGSGMRRSRNYFR